MPVSLQFAVEGEVKLQHVHGWFAEYAKLAIICILCNECLDIDRGQITQAGDAGKLVISSG